MKYKRFGVMLDCSRNAVMKVSKLKEFIDFLAKAGYNTLELYLEDTYEVEGEPYFGYMRGGYTIAEIREVDEYAKKCGVELIPAIQTLAHFTNLVKLPPFADIVDVNDILLIDADKTYELIDKMFSSLSKAFSTREINIGMDEAHMVGLGKYLDLHGYTNRYEILLRHLNKVADIAKKYGFNAHMWSDMFFRLNNHGEYYGRGLVVSEDICKNVPENVAPVYWDYYHTDEADYDAMITSHKAFGKELWFAGGAWSWVGFTPHNDFTLKSMLPAMRSVRRNGVENVIITMWGDNGKECSSFSLLPSLYAVRRFADGVEDLNEIKQEFDEKFGVSFDSLRTLDIPDLLPVRHGEVEMPSKIFLYCDPFTGIFDDRVDALGVIRYGEYAKKLDDVKNSAKCYGYIFEALSDLCSVLEKKYDLGVRLRKAYKAGNKADIAEIARQMPTVIERLDKFYNSFSNLWYTENKPFGFEVQDARIGGLRLRIQACEKRIEDYLKGKIDKIDELEIDILPHRTTADLMYNSYRGLVSFSEL